MNLLIIGLGSMGKRRARLIEGMGAGHTISAVDFSFARRAEGEALGYNVYETIDAALAGGRPHAALVCTAPLSHAAIISTLLDADLPVFTELNLVGDGYNEIMQKAGQKGLPLFLSNTMLYRAETQYIAKQVAAFGRPVNYMYHIGQYLPDWHPWENYKDFFVGDARTGGVREILGIDLPWLYEAFGPVTSAYVQKDKLTELDLPYPDSWYITLRHQSGAKGFVAANVVSPRAVRHFEVFGEGLHLLWEGNPRELFHYDTAAKEAKLVSTYKTVEQDARYSDNIVENAYVDELLNFFDVLDGKAQPLWTFEKDKAVIKLMDLLQENNGEEVQL